jgi:ABC-type Fe3+ transport system permease subunit
MTRLRPYATSALLMAATVAGLVMMVVVHDREVIAGTLLGALAAISTVFVATYSTRSRWRATREGMVVMQLVVCMAAIGWHGAANAFTDSGYPGRDVIRPLLLLAIVVTVLHLLLRLVAAQRRSEDGR